MLILAWVLGRRIDGWFAGSIAATVVLAIVVIGILFLRSRRRGRRIGLANRRSWPVIAALTVALALSGLVLANSSIGWFHTLRGVLGYPDARQLALPAQAIPYPLGTERFLVAQPPRLMVPARGVVQRMTIPSTHRFRPRDAFVYLPPAALHPVPGVQFPVLIMMTGQPGRPAEVFSRGDLAQLMDAYAAQHAGDAPIVVVPDQLQHSGVNPMCVDSPLGQSYSYLTDDLPRWIAHHLPVTTDHRLWAVGGYSEGGTCALQLSLKRPDLFATFIDVCGEEAPTIGRRTVEVGFHGSAAAYRSEQPLQVLRARHSWAGTDGMFGFGELDSYWGYQTHTVQLAAAHAGMVTQLVIVPNSGHSWRTVDRVFGALMPDLGVRLGMQAAASTGYRTGLSRSTDQPRVRSE